MCGRTACTLKQGAVSKACAYFDGNGKPRSVSWQANDVGNGRGYCPSYNLAPSEVTPCLVSGAHFESSEKRVLQPMVWGMIPRWHKGDYTKHDMKSHNGRIEGLANSKLYSQPLKAGRRCVILCDGYFEWQKDGKQPSGVKQPYFIYAKQDEGFKIEERQTWENNWTEKDGWKGIKLLKLAGIFESWSSAEGQKIYSCTMITSPANDVLSWLHHRVPLFLDTDKEVEDWLDYENIPWEVALKNLHGPTKDAVNWHPVSKRVNNSKFKEDTCCLPINLPEKKTQVAGSSLMTSWLATGTMKTAKRKSTEGEKEEIKKIKPDIIFL